MILTELEKELVGEYEITKKFISLFPEHKSDYKPHEKSMDICTLSNHIVEIFAWPHIILKTEKLDFSTGDYKPTSYKTSSELLKKLEEDYLAGKSAINEALEEDLKNNWDIVNGDITLSKFSKLGAIRHSLNQITHHRAQLGVYFRLLDINLPASYGPSYDTHEQI